MGIKAQDIPVLAIGAGLLSIGGWLLYREHVNSKLLREFMEKVERAETAYRNALEQERYEDAERILEFYEARMREEEEVIKSRGLFDQLRDLLASAGIVIGAVAGLYVIKWLTKRFPPPPPYKCPFDGQAFSTLELLEQHIRQQHPVEDAKIAEGQSAYNSLPRWLRGLVSAFSGIDEWMLEESWGGLPRWQIAALAAAAVVIVVLCWWLAPWLVTLLGRIAAMAKAVPVPA